MAKPSVITFDKESATIHCLGCLDRIPISRQTLRFAERFTQEMEMARELHQDCGGKTPSQARVARIWREGIIRNKYAAPQPIRLVWSA